MMRTVYTLVRTGLILLAFTWAAPALAQDPNECDQPGESPDVIVGSLQSVGNYGVDPTGEFYGYSVGTTSCNIGSCWLNWFSGTNQHPVIGQNMYRIKDGRLDQIGQSWLKHGFFALSQNLCSGGGCLQTNGDHLGVNCSDPYTSSLNGSQSNLGPRSEVNPVTGFFPYPFTGIGVTGDAVFRRVKVHKNDIDPALNPGAVYFVEGQYITADDAGAGRGDNNASWREITITPGSNVASVTGSTQRTEDAVAAWQTFQPSVTMTNIKVINDGLLILGADTFINGDGTRRFVYAVHNLNSDRGVRSFEIPIPPGAVLTNVYFNDTDSHSGEPYDTTDWPASFDYANSRLVWKTQTFDEDPNANAIRWGTVYTFGFDIDMTGVVNASIDLGMFKPEVFPGDPMTVSNSQPLPTPAVCDFDNICERGETCTNCPSDCTTIGSGGFCGDGICDPGASEDCLNCSPDCNGLQTGDPFFQFCCAQGGGTNPAFCIDPRCNDMGNTCMNLTGSPTCCGDGFCDASEDACQCAADCGPSPLAELTCGDSIDNDCDGNVDCADSDCCTDTLCTTGTDNDNDGVSDCDCDDGNPNVWGQPSEIGTLLLDGGAGTTLNWGAPGSPGATTVSYETMRTSLVDVWQYTVTCMADADPFDLSNSDAQVPVAGGVFYYLVRGANGCPGAEGIGTLGQGRVSPACP